jgi:DNA-binding MarR family transcriptional regulator
MARSSKTARKLRFDSPQQEAFLNLWRTYDCLKALEDELFGEHQISAQQYNALRLLGSRHPGSMPTQTLGKLLISRAPDITRMLDRLEQRGLIERVRRSGNRRVVEVFISPAGRKLLDELARPVREMHARQLGHLTPAELKQLVSLSKQVRAPHEDASCDWLDS